MKLPEGKLEYDFSDKLVDIITLKAAVGALSKSDYVMTLENSSIIDSWEFEEVVESLSPAQADCIPYLFEILNDPTSESRQRILAIDILGRSEVKDPVLLTLLKAQFEDDHPAVREATLLTLGRMIPQTEEFVKLIETRLFDHRPYVRILALQVLSRIGNESKLAVPGIQQCLRDEYLKVRLEAIRCLGELGKVATPAIDELEELTKSETFLIHDEARLALAKIRLAK